MDDHRIGRSLRALRLRAGLQQVDVARRAGVSQSLVSAIEGGRFATVTIETLRRVFAAVGAGFDGQVLWRGPALERLLDARHAALVDASAIRLHRWRWDVMAEVTYSSYGERGSIDLLGTRADRRAVVVEEIKSELARVEETVRKLDEKARLIGSDVGRDRLGWTPHVGPGVGPARHGPGSTPGGGSRGGVRRHATGTRPRPAGMAPRSGRSNHGDPFVADIDRNGRNVARPGAQRVRVGPRR